MNASPPRVGQLITRTESGERVTYRITHVDEATRTVKMEYVSVAGYVAIGHGDFKVGYGRRPEGGARCPCGEHLSAHETTTGRGDCFGCRAALRKGTA